MPHSIKTMDITIHSRILTHEDPDASLTVCRDHPEVVLLLLQAGPS